MNKLPMLGPWLRHYFTEHIVSERNLAVNTQKSYRDTFLLFLSFITKKYRIAADRLRFNDISSERVLEFLEYVEKQRKCSVQTRNQRLNAFRAFARYIASREPVCIEWAASIRAISTKKAMPTPLSWLTKDEVEALISAPCTSTHRGQIEHALLLLLYNTGARASEIVALKVADVQVSDHNGRHSLVTLHGKGGKIRQCPIWPRTTDVLADVIREKHDRDFVFISQRRAPYTRFGVYRLVERCAAGIPQLADKKVTPHVLRHSSACHMLNAGVDINTIRAWLGHVNINTTNIYAEIDFEMKLKAMELCDIVPSGLEKPSNHRADILEYLESL